MTINRNEFNALRVFCQKANCTQREIASSIGCSLGTANTTCKALNAKGLIANNEITPFGLEELEPYKVENAVIMAAGLSSRFAPISYEKPKGLLKVRGEILIERQIEQLKEAGIDDIYVVVGYKKECFFYLEQKYGVKIVINNEYASRNNNSSLMRVKNHLSNSYICSSDDYFTTNPFESYVWKAYYSAEYSEGPTEEWCIQTGNKDRIVGVEIGGSNSWYMIGHVFFDKAFSRRFARILEDEYGDPRTADKLWETIFIEHISEFDMEMRKYEQGTIFEFDSLDELREFDPFFLDNLDSDIFKHITETIGCTKNEIHDVYPLKQGLTNLSCHFSTNSGEYVYRHPGIGTEKMIDRKAEMRAQEIAKEIGIDNTFIYEDPNQGWKISHFIPNCRELNPHDNNQLKQAMNLAKKLHKQKVSIDRAFDYYEEGLKYESLLLKKGPVTVSDYEEMAQTARKLKECTLKDASDVCLCHNDFFNLNLLFDEEDNLSLIDWEYAGMSDYASDYGTFVVTCMLNEEEADLALTYYFDRKPSIEERRHNYAYVALAGWCWYVWALQKESEGDFVGDWLYTYYSYAKQYAQKALALYEIEN